MNAELQQVLTQVESFSSAKCQFGIYSESSFERRLTLVMVLAFLAMLALFFVETFHWLAVVAGLIYLFAMMGLTIAQVTEGMRFFPISSLGYAHEASTRVAERSAYIEELAGSRPDAIRMAIDTLERDISRLQRRLYSMVGAVEKAGFIPAALVFYFAAARIAAGNSDSALNMLTVFIFGFYGSAFLGHRMIELLTFNISCLRESIILSERRLKLSDEPKLDRSA